MNLHICSLTKCNRLFVRTSYILPSNVHDSLINTVFQFVRSKQMFCLRRWVYILCTTSTVDANCVGGFCWRKTSFLFLDLFVVTYLLRGFFCIPFFKQVFCLPKRKRVYLKGQKMILKKYTIIFMLLP